MIKCNVIPIIRVFIEVADRHFIFHFLVQRWQLPNKKFIGGNPHKYVMRPQLHRCLLTLYVKHRHVSDRSKHNGIIGFYNSIPRHYPVTRPALLQSELSKLTLLLWWKQNTLESRDKGRNKTIQNKNWTKDSREKKNVS